MDDDLASYDYSRGHVICIVHVTLDSHVSLQPFISSSATGQPGFYLGARRRNELSFHDLDARVYAIAASRNGKTALIRPPTKLITSQTWQK
jgi:hypothetical protein